MSQVHTLKRARTDSQKENRRQAILKAAGEHFCEVGFENFSMATLARLAGVAKGTLYLYFSTREEVLLDLYMDGMRASMNRMRAALHDDISDEQFIQAFLDTVSEDATFVALGLRLQTVIEHNISINALVDTKRSMRVEIDAIAADIGDVLGLTPEASFDLLVSLNLLLLGVTLTKSGPSPDLESLPEDVCALLTQFREHEGFLTNARRILAGIRIEYA